jgi:hypothetical protein
LHISKDVRNVKIRATLLLNLIKIKIIKVIIEIIRLKWINNKLFLKKRLIIIILLLLSNCKKKKPLLIY